MPFPDRPVLDDQMIVVKSPYTQLILSGAKTLELRHQPIKQDCYLACSTTHQVVAWVRFGPSSRITVAQFRATLHLHHCAHTNGALPYKQTYSTPILEVSLLREPVPYQSKLGAIGRLRFLPVEEIVTIR